MALSLKTPLEQEFSLDKSDAKYGDGTSKTIVRFRQATQGAVELHDSIYSSVKRVYHGAGGVEVVDQKPQAYISKMEVMSTMSFCDILDSGGKQLFTFENSRIKEEKQFLEAWASLPPDVAVEIHECCLKANPQWTAAGEA